MEQLLSYLDSLDVKLWIEDDRLKYNAPKGVMSKELLAQLKEDQARIREYLQRKQRTATYTLIHAGAW